MKQHEKELSTEVAESPVVLHFPDGQMDGCGSLDLQEREMALLDEDIRLWSSGKERNIQLQSRSTLLGLPCPANSVGNLPLGYINLNEAEEVETVLANAKQWSYL